MPAPSPAQIYGDWIYNPRDNEWTNWRVPTMPAISHPPQFAVDQVGRDLMNQQSLYDSSRSPNAPPSQQQEPYYGPAPGPSPDRPALQPPTDSTPYFGPSDSPQPIEQDPGTMTDPVPYYGPYDQQPDIQQDPGTVTDPVPNYGPDIAQDPGSMTDPGPYFGPEPTAPGGAPSDFNQSQWDTGMWGYNANGDWVNFGAQQPQIAQSASPASAQYGAPIGPGLQGTPGQTEEPWGISPRFSNSYGNYLPSFGGAGGWASGLAAAIKIR
jgi:hypothetical protein